VENLNTLTCDLFPGQRAHLEARACASANTSMTPAIQPGDLLFIRRLHFQGISVGQIVLYARDCRLITHRVAEKSSAPGPGIWLLAATVSFRTILRFLQTNCSGG